MTKGEAKAVQIAEPTIILWIFRKGYGEMNWYLDEALITAFVVIGVPVLLIELIKLIAVLIRKDKK
jgi:hypothetical protein